MASLARDYHDSLQREERNVSIDDREETIKEVLKEVNVSLPIDTTELRNTLTEEDVYEALRSAATGKAAGVDRIPYELWKILDAQHQADSEDKSRMNIVGVLTKFYNDMEIHGVIPGLEFTKGWLCPIYKKGD